MAKRKKQQQSASALAGGNGAGAPVTGNTQLNSPGKPKIQYKLFFILMGIVALVAAACYVNTLWFGMALNDNATLSGIVGNKSPEDTLAALTIDHFVQPLTQPWLRTSYALDMKNYGMTFGWYHFVNVVLHLCTTVALYALIFRLANRFRTQEVSDYDPYQLAFIAALLFACHPLASQAVAYISGRYAPLAAVNFLLAIFCFVGGLFAKQTTGRTWAYIGTIAFSFMCLNSSELALALPPTLVVLMFLLKPANTAWLDWTLEKPIVSAILLLSFNIWFFYVLGFQPAAVADSYMSTPAPGVAYFATQFKAFVTYYLRCAFVPIGLSIVPPFTRADNFGDPLAIIGVIVAVAMAAGIYLCRKRPLVSVSFVLILAGFLPHAFLYQPELVADPVFYLSLTGVCLLLGLAFMQIVKKQPTETLPVLIPLVLVLGSFTVMRNLEWANDMAIGQAALRSNAASAQAHVIMASAYLQNREYDKAETEADAALQDDHDSAFALLARGAVYNATNRYDKANEAFERGLALATKQKLPLIAQAKLGLAETQARLQHPGTAETYAQAALSDPSLAPRAVYVLGLTAAQQDDNGKAYTYFRMAAQHGVTDALEPLARAAFAGQHYEDAMAAASAAAAHGGGVSAQIIMAEAALELNQLPQAESALKDILNKEPQNSQALALMSIYQEKKGDKNLANSYRQDALRIDPNVFSRLGRHK